MEKNKEKYDLDSYFVSEAHKLIFALLFTEILGVRQKEGTAGFSDVQIQPADISALDWVCGSIRTPAGEISVNVKRDQNGKRTAEYTIS